MLEKERAPIEKDNKEKQVLQMVGISPGKMIIINLKKSLDVGGVIIIEISGARPWMFSIRGGNVESPIDLDWGELGN